MSKAKRKVKQTVALDGYKVLCRAVEEGAADGMRRAWEYRKRPKGWTEEDAAHVQSLIEDSVISAIAEMFIFGEPA